ncbi:uncharacterized protein MONBRDRAFT_37093 [Monosiga brevicollis MX1]|uniref:Thioredoxin-like fold domain-containing protein n=1 Tax=Monosiga brevicollis TaxID=81824 RepID=A9UZJ1_MONBE|nr:uncharacterized protein MONBRDRAFT_37093 [Monosiga brevicollis MX1]EDQ89378.1 predicted protein [Monosiga brevicollis MX1]|eukprot:XP_001745954.1 hypothetical protein [Monosiga brevicollis MX1]
MAKARGAPENQVERLEQTIFFDGVYDANNQRLDVQTIFDTNEVVGILWMGWTDMRSLEIRDKIIEHYNLLKSQNARFELIFVSGDETLDDYNEHVKIYPCPRVPYNPSIPLAISRNFYAFAPPRILLFDSNGQLFTKEGDGMLLRFPEKFPWKHHIVNLNQLFLLVCVIALLLGGLYYFLLHVSI